MSTLAVESEDYKEQYDLYTNLYTHLTKTTEGSSKFCNYYIAECRRGEFLYQGENKAPQNGYQVYSIYGKIDGTPIRRYIGFYFSEEGAVRVANRGRESKIQKGYTDHGNEKTNPATRTIPENPETRLEAKPEEPKLNFPPVAKTKPKMTATQISRFSNLLE